MTATLLAPAEKPARHQPGGPKHPQRPIRRARRDLARMRDEQVVAICEGLIDLLADMFCVPGRELRAPGKAAKSVSRIRQIAMYVAHVILQLTMAEIGKGFARDRTTVVHACHSIEDMRDEAAFDEIVAVVERAVQRQFASAVIRRD